MNKKIENLIVKFLSKEVNLDELRQLEIWIGNPENEILFNEYIKTNALINRATGTYDTKSAKTNIAKRIKEKNRVFRNKYKLKNSIKYAVVAAIAGLLTTVYIFRNSSSTSPAVKTAPIIVNKNIEPGTDKATLTLEDGSVVALEKGNAYQTQNANSNGEEIVYEADAGERNTKEVAYNYLTIPRGGQFYVVLSDGTRVWLNSETQLKYPVSFKYGKTRQVELVYGEAYFDVAPSEEHEGTKFKVINNAQELEVVGTEFNIKAFKDELNIYTTLVEGKVKINTSAAKRILSPNQQSNVDITSNDMSVEIVDVETEISWKNGIFIFKGKPLKDIMKVISRWYDVDVVFENKNLESVKFRGILDKHQKIEEILSIIKSSNLNDYEIINETVILR